MPIKDVKKPLILIPTLVVLGGVIFGLANILITKAEGPYWGLRLDSDRAFYEMLQRKMPDFQLTEELIGRPVVRSPGYNIRLSTNSIKPPAVPEEHFIDYISEFEKDGVNPVTLFQHFDLTTQNPYTAKFDFPGCEPNECVDRAREVKAEKDLSKEYLLFSQFRHAEGGDYTRVFDLESVMVHTETINEIHYEAELTIRYDGEFRVIRYCLNLGRDGVTKREQMQVEAIVYATGNNPVLPIFRYCNNMAVGIERQTFDPSPY